MDERVAPAWAEIDLSAIRHNVRALQNHAGSHVEIIAVVKANAYGHGAVPVSRAALDAGARSLAVARVSEGVALRQAGIDAPIFVMGYALPAEAESIVTHDLSPTVNTIALADSLEQLAVQHTRRLAVYLKVDTGMGRFGLLPDEVLPFAQQLLQRPHLRFSGLWTHFAVADEADKEYTHRQFQRYRQTVAILEDAGIPVPRKFTANSAAILDLPEMHLDAVRAGIALYGLYPSPHVSQDVALRPALSLKAHLGRVRKLPPGSDISYGRTYTTSRETPVGLVPVGYGDGYSRALSNRGKVLVRGHRVPIIGRICMDQFMVDLTTAPHATQDDEVVLIGSQGGERISAEEVASWLGTINYEVTTAIAARIPRHFVGR
ncbi:MAG: alanine racemase [Chloroflexi bacterium]|nr:alanine racemase [Chloroflexota bacterium]